MDSELRALLRDLQANPSSLDLRRRYTRAAIRANTGHFLIWRGGTGVPPDSDYIEINQKIFPGETSPVITQQCQCYGVADLADLSNLLHLQPSGLLTLPEHRYQSFRSPIIRPRDDHKHLYDIKCEPLYDTAYTQGDGIQELNFFRVPVGGSSVTPYGGEWPWNTHPKDYTATNMDQGGSLPYPKQFQITGLSIVLGPETTHADAINFVSNTVVRVIFGTQDRTVLPSSQVTLTPINTPNRNPLIRFTSGDNFEPTHPFPFRDEALYNPKEPWASVESDYCLIPERHFRVQIFSQSHLRFSQRIKVMCILHGYFYRQVV